MADVMDSCSEQEVGEPSSNSGWVRYIQLGANTREKYIISRHHHKKWVKKQDLYMEKNHYSQKILMPYSPVIYFNEYMPILSNK